MITTLRITGMSCNNCIRHVGEALRGVAGVSRADVALGGAEVVHDETATLAQLVTAVESAGYEVSRSPADPPIGAS